MRKLIISLFTGLLVMQAFAQPELKFSSSRVVIERDENANKEYFIQVLVIRPGPTVASNTVKFKISTPPANTNHFRFSTVTRSLSEEISSVNVPITIVKGDQNNPEDSLEIDIYDNSDNALGKKIKIVVKNPEKASQDKLTKEKSDTTKWLFRIVTGSNFDFFDAPTFKNFAGDLNVFLPSLFNLPKDKNKPSDEFHKIGLQFGIFNYRYFEADSSRGVIQTEKYFLNPNTLTPVVDTTKYIRHIYALDSKISYNNWGLYLNPMYELKSTDWASIYLNLHFEVLWRTQILSHSKADIRKDTFTVTANDVLTRTTFAAFPGIRPSYQQINFTDYYIGVGLPIRIDIKKKVDLFLTPTIGISSFGTATFPTTVIQRGDLANKTKNTEAFFLGKFQLTTTVAPIDIALGGEYRKINGQKSFLGMYLGAALTLDKLKR